MKRLSVVSLFLLLVQVGYGNYAFYSKVELTCQAYRIPVDRSAMDYRGDIFSLELKSRSRNDFEMAMLIGFAAVGRAVMQQRDLQKAKPDFSPMLPGTVQISVLVPMERHPMVVTATTNGDLVEKLARGEIETTEFMQKIKDTIEIH
ncbi:MAG: hypothetical protein GXO90_06870 [FCB group bacterium]|nr:hypothetical protein [FCB group bacterium]